MKPTNVPYVMAEIRIVYGIDENGSQVTTTTYAADGIDDAIPDLFTGSIMLKLGELDFLQRHNIFAAGHGGWIHSPPPPEEVEPE